MDTSLIFWIISWLFITAFCLKYLQSVLQGETRPHMYTIILYTVITGIIFYTQIISGAWFWAMYVGITCAFWILIFFLSFKYGIKDITFSDKFSLLLALISIPIWYVTGDPFLAVILLIIVDIFSSYPTVRKTYVDPYSENIQVFVIEFIWLVFSILALSQINFNSAAYLFYILVFDVLMFSMIYIRRKKILPK